MPDLALLAGLGNDNVAVLVLGEAEVAAETADGHVALSGRDSLTWVDRVLQAPSRIVVGMPGARRPSRSPWVDLVDGVVPGGGALLEPGPRVPPSRPPPRCCSRGAGRHCDRDAGARDRPHRSLAPAPSVDEDGEANPPRRASTPRSRVRRIARGPVRRRPLRRRIRRRPRRQPPPALRPTRCRRAAVDEPARAGRGCRGHRAPGAAAARRLPGRVARRRRARAARARFPSNRRRPPPRRRTRDAAHTDLVEGVYCKRGHFTDPDSQFCIVCGIGLYETKIKRKGVRPELGFLVFDDGSVFHLDHDYVLGRQPEVDEEVKAGTVRGLRLDDSGGTVSRAHAIVRLVGWNVTIADRKSQNGTLVAAKGSDQFVPVSRDQPITLVPGSRIQLGQRTLVYESQRGRS